MKQDSQELKGYKGIEKLWNQDPEEKEAQRFKPGIWCCLCPRDIYRVMKIRRQKIESGATKGGMGIGKIPDFGLEL